MNKRTSKIIGIITLAIGICFLLGKMYSEKRMKDYLREVEKHEKVLDELYEKGVYNDEEYNLIFNFIEEYSARSVWE